MEVNFLVNIILKYLGKSPLSQMKYIWMYILHSTSYELNLAEICNMLSGVSNDHWVSTSLYLVQLQLLRRKISTSIKL